MITRSPTRACVIVAAAPIVQSRPIRTCGPTTAVAAITVPAPISAPGPTTAPGSIVTPFSTRAEGCTCAPDATPFASNSEDGRIASANSARATVTKARYGSRTNKTVTWAGARRGELLEISRIFEKREIGGTGPIERRDIVDSPVAVRDRAHRRAREGHDLAHAQSDRALEEHRLR